MPVACATGAVVAFVALLKLFKLVEKTGDVVVVTQGAIRVIGSTSLSDDEKEKLLQAQARRLFWLALVLLVGGAAALLLPFGVIWVGDRLGWVSLDAVIDVSVSPVFLTVAGVASVVALFGRGKSKPRPESPYSPADQTLHRLAFSTRAPQIALSGLEDRLFAKALAAGHSRRPVFVTALPRAGTTLLLETCAKLPDFAAHCYRDMPFVLTPLLWDRFTSRFRKRSALRERAHGDGMLINVDSPEALEEVLWLSFWHAQYREDRIAPWDPGADNPEFTAFFESHMRKLVVLRRGPGARDARYISKNNLNIARTPLLRRIFPDATILVPFRLPLHHAASLLEQHRNFLEMHARDPFSVEYTREIGHFDFGVNLKPVDFDGWLDRRLSTDTQSLAFWLEYWVAAYRHLLSERTGLHFVSYDMLCEDPPAALRRLAELMDIGDRNALQAASSSLRPQRPRGIDTSGVPDSILQAAGEIHEALLERASARPNP